MNFDPYYHLEQYELHGAKPPGSGLLGCTGEAECLCQMRRVLADIRLGMEMRTDWLPFSYKAYFYGATCDAPDSLYFCITDEPVRNLGQPVDCLLGEVMPEWFYVRLHIVNHPYVYFKIDSPTDKMLRCEIHCPGHKDLVKPIACGDGNYMEQVNRSLGEYLEAAFPA